MGTLAKFANDTKPDENCKHCRVSGMEVPEKLYIFSGKMRVNLGKHVTESTGQILNIPPSKKICRINKKALAVTSLWSVTVAEESEVFYGSGTWKKKTQNPNPTQA